MRKTICGILLVVLLLSGCGHKSDSEITDIEQFRCSDSIETVFDVLGETKIVTDGLGGERYEYDNLNLYGYNGEAIFRVRDDEDTIRSFECSLELNKREFENVLSQLSDKYGDYEKSEYTNQIAYVWEFSDSEAEKLGYNRISLSDYGNKKAVIDFDDEWSIYKDEAYYEYLEEKNKPEVLAEKTYNIGNDNFRFSFSKEKDGEYRTSLFCDIEDKSDAFYTHMALNSMMNSDDEDIKKLMDLINLSYTISIGDGTSLINTGIAVLLMSDDESFLPLEEYFSTDWLANESRESDYGTQVIGFLGDFIENN